MRLPDLALPRTLALAAAALLSALPAAAQTMRVLQAAPLRADRSSETALAQLAVGQNVTLLQMSGGWVRVQSGKQQGWLRASQVELPGADVAEASLRESGRRANGANAVTLGVRSFGLRNGRHALIVGLGNYRRDPKRPMPPLTGMPQDMASALAMALRLEVPREQMTLLRDSAATRDGLRAALRELATQLQPGDRVFVYWSGQGAKLADGAAACTDALLPYDLQAVAPADFTAWLQPVLDKAAKVLFVTDVAASDTRCQVAATVAPNLVQLSAPRTDETGGGLATAALRQCVLENANRPITELAACAQTRVDTAAKGLSNVPRVTLSGPGDYVPL